MTNADDLIRKYAKEIERIITQDTIGDYTWNGLLFSFLREVDESRTLKYEVETFDGDTVNTFSVLQNETAPEEDEHKRYDIQLHDTVMGWTIFASNLTYDNAQEISSAFRDDVTWRLVDHGASTEEDKPEKEPELLYDVKITRFGETENYAYKVPYDEAQALLREAPFWQAPRIVVNEESLNDDKSDPEEKTYDVHVHDGWWKLLASDVSKEHADALVKDLRVRYIIEEHDNGGPIYSDDDYMDGCDKY